MQALAGKIAVVTGASRGAGRGIALELGAAGATVYVTGRTMRGTTSTAQRRETVEDTAEVVSAQGGVGIAVACDHTVDEQVAALFERVRQEQGGLDLLVNNAWGGYEGYNEAPFDAPFWEQPIARWDRMFTAGLRSHLVSTRAAVPLMLPQRRGLIIHTTTFMGDEYHGSVFYDVVKTAINRMAFGMGQDLRPHEIAVLALAPGWMRTEVILETFHTTEESWRTVPDLRRTESPHYVGRAIVALASDPAILERSGRTLLVGDLAPEYGFTDIDGRRPRFYDKTWDGE